MRMRSYAAWLLVAAASAALWLATAGGAIPDTTADRAFGQPDLVSVSCNRGAAASDITLCDPRSVAVSPTGRVYIADTANNRVVYYDDPRRVGTVPDGVIGQTDYASTFCNGVNGLPSASTLCEPVAVDLDGAGNLYVADRGNSRVLYYAGGAGAADLVFGQPNFTTFGCSATSASTLCLPEGVSADDFFGNVYISDTGSSRVLGYHLPLTTDLIADRVFGQADYITTGCNTGGISATSLCSPQQLNFHGTQHLFVADTANNRVVLYDNPLANSIADVVLGQPSFADGGCNTGGISASTLCGPSSVAIDDDMNTYVADRANRRVLRYDDPLLTDTIAEEVRGQASFTATTCWDGGPSATSLCYPRGIAYGAFRNDIMLTEDQGHRALQFDECALDLDCDGFSDAVDNCMFVANPGQENADGEFIDNPAPLTQDDNTHPAADVPGDVCDTDADNDGLSNNSELFNPVCATASGPTDPLNPDTDGDSFLDSRECTLVSNPNDPASKPFPLQCGATTDGDGDFLTARTEYCGLGIFDTDNDSDNDGRRDGCEAASLNMQAAVNSGDQLILAQAINADQVGPSVSNADINKDGANNSGDQLLMAQIRSSGTC